MNNRLTYKEPNGDFGVVGMNENNREEKLYSCVMKLMDYEEQGLAPSEVELLKKMYDGAVLEQDKLREKLEKKRKKGMPKKAIYDGKFYSCPTCGDKMLILNGYNFCSNCGQALDWSEEK